MYFNVNEALFNSTFLVVQLVLYNSEDFLFVGELTRVTSKSKKLVPHWVFQVHISVARYIWCAREREKDKEGLYKPRSRVCMCVCICLCARARPCPQTITPYRIRLPLRARCQLLKLNMVRFVWIGPSDFNVSSCFRGVYYRLCDT